MGKNVSVNNLTFYFIGSVLIDAATNNHLSNVEQM